ncbi:glycosyl transferase family 2 [Pseudomonas sp. S25]|uniref:Glycosyl transferase family 2 n=1 Tax=Pseudomonas maioricensis TaxID=1766623 RepID=A0ABS9ZJ12_9PSED|nr:TIGR00180 family glycosyltransferase [Pseudomonas sp. S25]MCI8210553.1 glycosyl transferase family 2 [Pseudomonas sp. S25]
MQSNVGKQASTSMRERLTVVLVAHKQPDSLRRALKYYADFSCAILVVDTSPELDAQVAQSGAQYLHKPLLAHAGASARTADILPNVTTPLVVMADVDSFLFADALNDAVQFLDSHEQYVACQGYSLTYSADVNHVNYFRRDRKVCEDYSAESPHERVATFMAQGFPLLNAVIRNATLQGWSASLPADTDAHWQEIGQMHYLLGVGKVRILPVPYALHAARDLEQEVSRDRDIRSALKYVDPKARAEREGFASTLSEISGAVFTPQQVLDGFTALAESLETQSYLASDKLVCSRWNIGVNEPEPLFEPRQFVELPFYTPSFFSLLERIEFLIHLMPAGHAHLATLESALLKQAELARVQSNPDAEALESRLWQAYELYSFNAGIVQRLIRELRSTETQAEEVERLVEWYDRLQAASGSDNGKLLDDMPSGRLLNWLDSRDPAPAAVKKLTAGLARNPKGSQIGILLLDLEADVFKLQATFDSLINGFSRSFKVIIFTTAKSPAVTTPENTLHFVKVSESNYVDKMNQSVKQSNCDWFTLVQAGEVFTKNGLLQASLELADAANCRAVAMDEIHRVEDGTLTHAFRPSFNLDLLQSSPVLMARHWLINQQAMLEAGGYSRELSGAIELDLLLRLIEQGGMSGLAHLSEPLLICDAPELEVNEDEQKALTRHLANRGYRAEVSSALSGTFKIDYRHAVRPTVSILLESRDNLPELQRCLQSILQRTRYQRYEVLICDNNSGDAGLLAWLDQQEQSSNRVRVFKSDQRLSAAVLRNSVSQEAKGEYLVLMDAESQIVNVGWIESLLNQAQRPEVGVVGVRLIDPEGTVTQAGLILGLKGGVGSAFVGEPKTSHGYMQRLVVEQNYSAVSSACLMIGKELYDAVGGLDEGQFADELGDVDLCLKAAQAGYLTVWTPHVQVVHSGEVRASESTLEALKDKWPGPFAHDEAYNSNLALDGPGFTLGAIQA